MSGGLLELVARGKKDIFFINNPKISFYHSIYRPYSAFTKEIYIAKPRNNPEWGRYVDFDIDHRGDIVNNFHLRISLPTWLPLSVRDINNSGIVSDTSGVTFGYTNNIGYQMIDKIQLFMDSVLIQETFGEYLDWRQRMTYDFGTTYLYNTSIGTRPETSLAIGRSSTTNMLRVPIPLLGWGGLFDPGLPLVSLRTIRFHLRVFLRPYQEILTASDGRLNPSPFQKTLLVQSSASSIPIQWPEPTLNSSCMKNLDICLESTNYYLGSSTNTWLKAVAFSFPFKHIQFQQYTIDDNIMNAVANGAPLKIPIKLDFSGTIGRLLIGFRSEASNLAGTRNILVPPIGMSTSYIQSMRVNIANIDRIQQWEPAIFREVSAYWKNKRMPLRLDNTTLPDDIFVITFNGYDSPDPSGTLSFTRAVLPTLYVIPSPTMYDIRNISRRTFTYIYAEGWNLYEVKNGKGNLAFDL